MYYNVIAGILIGVANNTWLTRLVIPFAWGVIWCIYLGISQGKLKQFVESAKKRESPAKWGMSHTQAFYFIEYSTATFTSLIFSLLSGFVGDFFF